MTASSILLLGTVAALACALAFASALGMAQGADSGQATKGARTTEAHGTAGPPPAAGPSSPSSVSGAAAAGRVSGSVTGDPAEGSSVAVPAAGASGRRDDPPLAAPASLSGLGSASDRAQEVAAAFECPREQIVRMLGSAVEEFEVSASMALERQVLVLCRDRWQVLEAIVDSELSLAEVLRADRLARAKAALELEEQRGMARARIEGARAGAEAAAKEAEARRLSIEAALAAPVRPAAPAADRPAEAVAVVREPEPAPHERYRWFTIIGAAGTLRAGVTDGERRWMVGVGDLLPGGLRITSISARPPRVRVADGPPSGLRFERFR